MTEKAPILIEIRKKQIDFNLDVSLALRPGLTSIYGRSGSGKTTLINIIAGLITPDQGRVIINDTSLYDSQHRIDVPPENRRIGYVFQEGRLFPHMSVKSNLLYARRFLPEPATPALFDEIVALLDLAGLLSRKPATLSGGEKQRVAIGRALLAEPRLLLMDEPLASLDAALKADILPFIERLRDTLNIPIFYVSHAMEEVIRLADHLVLMSDGSVAAEGPVDQVMSRIDLKPLTGRYEAGAVIDVQIHAHDEVYHLTELRFAGHTLFVPHINTPKGSTMRLRIRARDVSLSTRRPTETSVLNVFKGTITDISPEEGPYSEILLDVGVPLIARVTRKSVAELKLDVGRTVYASIKAVAIDRHTLGLGRSH